MIAPARQEWLARGRCLSRFPVEVSGNAGASPEHPARGGHYGQADSARLTTGENIPFLSLYGMDEPLASLISQWAEEEISQVERHS